MFCLFTLFFFLSFFLYLFILFVVLRPFEGYFSSYETGQSVGVTKKRENTGASASRTACLTCGQCGAQTYTKHSGEMIE